MAVRGEGRKGQPSEGGSHAGGLATAPESGSDGDGGITGCGCLCCAAPAGAAAGGGTASWTGWNMPSAGSQTRRSIPSAGSWAGLSFPSTGSRTQQSIPSARSLTGWTGPSAGSQMGQSIPSAGSHTGLSIPSDRRVASPWLGWEVLVGTAGLVSEQGPGRRSRPHQRQSPCGAEKQISSRSPPPAHPLSILAGAGGTLAQTTLVPWLCLPFTPGV